ncbi:MAG TPA: glycosyltransferase [Candidatus Nanoarchaeia archaeon]|nr:glycosyltransferase [Candidatus Nanoarchaeia archaeon]
MGISEFLIEAYQPILLLRESKFVYFSNIISSNAFDFLLVIAAIVSTIYLYIGIRMLLFYKKKSINYKVKEEDLPFVTIQIPTYNEPAAIQCAIKCLENDYPKDKYEILIGDDSKDPKISKMLKDFAKLHNNVRVIKRKDNIGFKAGNLNNMLNYSNGEILVLFDSDFLPPKDFLRRIIAPFNKSNKIAAVQARWSFIKPNKNLISLLSSTILSVIHNLVLPLIYRKSKITFICGSAEAVKKSILKRLGGWKSGSFTEDIDYSLRILKNGYKIVYLEDLECKGEVPYTPKDFYKQQMRWAYGVIRAYIDHGLDVFKTKDLRLKDKTFIFFFGSGYLISFLLVALFITGFIAFITHMPEPLNISEFMYYTTRNILVTSGLIFASSVALVKKDNLKKVWHMIAASFSYGLVVMYYVNKGMFKALFNKPMQWHLLKKEGNKVKI